MKARSGCEGSVEGVCEERAQGFVGDRSWIGVGLSLCLGGDLVEVALGDAQFGEGARGAEFGGCSREVLRYVVRGQRAAQGLVGGRCREEVEGGDEREQDGVGGGVGKSKVPPRM